jgi:hypothetical protein
MRELLKQRNARRGVTSPYVTCALDLAMHRLLLEMHLPSTGNVDNSAKISKVTWIMKLDASTRCHTHIAVSHVDLIPDKTELVSVRRVSEMLMR